MADTKSYPNKKPDFKLYSYNSHSSQGSSNAIIDIKDIMTVVNTNLDDRKSDLAAAVLHVLIKYKSSGVILLSQPTYPDWD
jgi:hypothetical protein